MHPYRRPQQGRDSTPRKSRADPSVRGLGQGSSRASTTNPPATPSRTSAHQPYGLPTTSSGVPIPSVPFPPLPAPPTGLSGIRLPPQIPPIDRACNQHHPNRPVAVSPAYSQPSPPAQPVPSSSNLFTPRRPSIPPWPQNPSPSAAVPPDRGPGYFSNAHHFEIPHLSINHHNQYTTPPKNVFDLLRPYICYGAAHNSDERTNAPACHANTRVAVQEDVVGWMRHDDGEAPKIMWLSGPAGCGKTAIAGSVAETCQKEGLLAASFFFSVLSGSADRYSKRHVVTTIASHLAEHPALSDYKEQLLLSIERHPSIFRKRLKEQAERLILDPLRFVPKEADKASWPRGIILDGLDEVVSELRRRDPHRPEEVGCDDDQLEILEVLLILIQSPAFPFRVFVASRPERNIATFFARPSAQDLTTPRFLDSKYNPDADIKLYLAAKFAEIRRSAWIGDVWPGEAVLDRLVEMSSGQFVVPTTIIRWVESGLPREQLKVVLQLQEGTVGSKNPFANLDALYRHILRRSYNPVEEDPLLVVKWVIVISSASEMRLSAVFWRQFLEDEEGELNYRMSPIASLASVPPPNDKDSCVTLYHKSLIDFLSTEARCGDLFVNELVSNTFVAHRILAVLQNKGPRAYRPLRGADLGFFLMSFLEIRLVLDLHERNTPFLFYLSGDSESRAILASCDVGWWTSNFLDYHALKPTLYLLIMLYKIHRTMPQCQDNAPFHRGSTDKARDSQCHPACVNWRTGILSKAKELGFCVHLLGEIQVDQLANSQQEVERICKGWLLWPMNPNRCCVCFPQSVWAFT